jgi:hypothetical protein
VTRSIYILGGAGTGKSTFMAALMEEIVMHVGPLTELATKPNARGTVITLRGHHFATYDGVNGTYVGQLREEYPGTDGLDRASSIAGEVWLENGPLNELVIAEGNTLATSRFLTALSEHTDLLLVHLRVEDFVRELRFLARGSTQNEGWVKNSDTRCRNLFTTFGGLDVDTADPAAVALALAACLTHLRGDE